MIFSSLNAHMFSSKIESDKITLNNILDFCFMPNLKNYDEKDNKKCVLDLIND